MEPLKATIIDDDRLINELRLAASVSFRSTEQLFLEELIRRYQRIKYAHAQQPSIKSVR